MTSSLAFDAVARLGQWGIGGVSALGRFAIFLAQALFWLTIPPFKVRQALQRVWFIGFRSISVILLTGAFTGMVLGLQGMLMLERVGSEAFVGPLVAIALVRELGPVLAALMVTGRAGSAVAAEIGVMRITEQIDALTVMALNPMRASSRCRSSPGFSTSSGSSAATWSRSSSSGSLKARTSARFAPFSIPRISGSASGSPWPSVA
jgi:ABC transport permease subunit